MLFLYYYYYAFLLLALKLISKNLSIWWALLSILVTFWGKRHLSGNNGALGWSILLEKQVQNELKPIVSLSIFAVYELTCVILYKFLLPYWVNGPKQSMAYYKSSQQGK